jgi:hypothetical protein
MVNPEGEQDEVTYIRFLFARRILAGLMVIVKLMASTPAHLQRHRSSDTMNCQRFVWHAGVYRWL